MNNNSSKIMLIGLDLADADLIDSWCHESYLPNISLLRQQGIWGRLRTSAEFMHVSAWPTLHTGTLPGKHGMYHAYQINPGEQNVHRTKAEECAQPPFWKFMDDAGKKCIVVDAFLNCPLEGYNGIQIINWGAWTWFSEPQATPIGLWKKILKKFGPYPAPEHSKVMDGAKSKYRLTSWLMKEYPWDIFYVTFAEPHPAGHYLWHYFDPQYPSNDIVEHKKFENAMRDVYIAVDDAIGRILQELDDSVTVLITSVDGIGPNYAGCHLMPRVLTKMNLYSIVGDLKNSDKNLNEVKGPRKSFIKSLRDLLPYNIRRDISRILPRQLQHQLSMKWANANIDWGRTKAFCIPNANEGYIRINLQGREPKGRVPPGSAYRDLCHELKDRCQELINPGNDLPAVPQVICSHELFDGERLSSLPDVVINWDYNAKVLSQLYSEKLGLIKSPSAGYQTEPYYTGNHRPAAFFIARGPNIKESKTLNDGHIVDIAPTLLAMMDIKIPENFDGKVWEDLL